MTTIDTAAVYGFGLSEELTGKAIKGKRDKGSDSYKIRTYLE